MREPQSTEQIEVICRAPVNIAVIKYWGKHDEELILPLNDSLSGTLSTDVMYAETKITTSPLLKENTFTLNGVDQCLDNPRLQNCIKAIKQRASRSQPHLNWKIQITSQNNFPTAAGLASSAAGYACLVYALSKLYNYEGEISGIARLGSGSACRSIYGGWVQWCRGNAQDGSDSIAKQIASASHWPEMRILILVVNDTRKKYSSTNGMKHAVETSDLLKQRTKEVVPRRIENITKAILDKDFHTFAEITMRDSNQFHAICLDTYPPCVYMNDVSHSIVDLVHRYNTYKGSNKVAYTFDAGPNACLYLLEQDVHEFVSLVDYAFPQNKSDADSTEEYYRGLPLKPTNILEEVRNSCGILTQKDGALKYIIYTKIGNGPKQLFA